MFGVPVDEKETREQLASYVEELEPAYALLAELSTDEVAKIKRLANEGSALKDALPATVVTDAAGKVLLSRLGAPSVSELRRFLREQAR